MSEQVGVAIIGVGGIVVNQHLKRLLVMPNVKVVGYLRNKSGRAEQAAKTHGGRLYETVDEVVGDPTVKAVYISVPPFAHGEIELKALAAGKALFIEKPIATDLETAERIGRQVVERNAIVAVGYQWRYQSTIRELLKSLSGGPILGASGWWCGGRPGVWWWRDKSKSGGQPVEQTTHVFDLANYVIGATPISVYAAGRKLNIHPEPDHTVDDFSMAQVRYDNGALLSVCSSDVMQGEAGKAAIEFYGVDRRSKITFGDLKIWEKEGMRSVNNESAAYQRINETFIHAVATGDRSKILADYATSLLTHRVTTAVERSIASGKVEAI